MKKYPYCNQCAFYHSPHKPHKTKHNERIVILLPSPQIRNNQDKFYKQIQQLLPDILNDPRYADITPDQVDYLYALECVCNKTPTEEDIKRCAQSLYTKLLLSDTKVILALGDTARIALQFPGTIYKLQKQTLTFTKLQRDYSVVFGYEPYRGNHLEHSLRHALNVLRVTTPIDVLTSGYYLPNFADHIVKSCQFITHKVKKPLSIHIAVNTNRSYLEHARILSIGVSWQQDKSCAFLFDHDSATFKAENVLPAVKAMLESDTPKIVHDFKFIQRFFSKYDITLNNVVHDTCYIEHMLHEAPEHSFTLFDLMDYYTPEFFQFKEVIERDLEMLKAKREAQFYDDRVPMPAISEYQPIIDMWGFKSENIIELRDTIRDMLKHNPALKKNEALLTNQKILSKKISSWRKKRNNKKLQEKLNEAKATDKLANLEHVEIGVLVRLVGASAESIHLISGEQKQLLKNENKPKLIALLHDVYFPNALVYGGIEHTGIKMDIDYLHQIQIKAHQQSTELTSKIHELVGKPFNIRSSRDLPVVLQERFNLPIKTKASTGNADLGKEAIDDLLQKDITPTAKQCLTYTTLLRSVDNASNLIESMNWYKEHVGRLHFTVNLCGTPTGRTSTTDINVQGLPGTPVHDYECPGGQSCTCNPINIKKVVVPDNSDDLIITLDVAGAEIRIMMAYAYDENLVKALIDGLDVHCWLASYLSGLPYQDKTTGMSPEFKQVRKGVKAVLYGTFYGMTPYGLARKLKVGLQRAKEIMNEVMNAVPSLYNYQQRCKTSIREKGYIETFFGRRRRFDFDSCKTPKEEWVMFRQAFNFPPQSTTRELLGLCLGSTNKAITEIGGRFLLERHDEFAFSIPSQQLDMSVKLIRQNITEYIATHFKWLPVPFVVDIKTGPNLGELTTL
jgi:DNA polymerase I-like protein with 3'-5' exonuclease and polymerase domains/uracil-DNA glycosylase